jgi:hypothetical protein
VGNLPQGGFQAQVVFAVKPPAAEE